MFDLELMGLLREYNNAQSKEQKDELFASLSRLVSQNIPKTQEFIEKNQPTEEVVALLESCAAPVQSSPSQNTTPIANIKNATPALKEHQTFSPQTNSNSSIVKDYYLNWLQAFKASDRKASDKTEEILDELINQFIVSKPEILDATLTIKDTADFETFKIMLKNAMRAYYATKIENYLDGNFKNLSPIQKFLKKRKLFDLLLDIGKYSFPHAKILEALQ